MDDMLLRYKDCFEGKYSQRNVNRFIEYLFERCARVLYERNIIPVIPEVVHTRAKTYYGNIQVNKRDRTALVRISHWNLLNPYYDFEEFIGDLFDTICHELAHLIVWDHGDDHNDCIEQCKILILNDMAVESIEYRLYGERRCS